jgi:hypothetical protein
MLAGVHAQLHMPATACEHSYHSCTQVQLLCLHVKRICCIAYDLQLLLLIQRSPEQRRQ